MVIPVMVIGFAVPMFLLANAAIAAEWLRVTMSSLSTPESAAEPLLSSAVAESLAS